LMQGVLALSGEKTPLVKELRKAIVEIIQSKFADDSLANLLFVAHIWKQLKLYVLAP
jgi:hypothetical protein